ncbi:MAG TPA: hypothetical protein VE981_15560 [Planctomycetota bacterium]|nr:hypothetical protein [Planctomycetota bacterium]
MDRKPKSKPAKKTLKAKSMKSVRGGSLNTYIESVPGEKQGGKPVGQFKSAGGLKFDADDVD